MFAAELYYNIMSGREQIDAEKWALLQQIAAQDDSGGGFGGFMGDIIGIATGGVAGKVGEKIADEIF